jgi:hypothetical protein
MVDNKFLALESYLVCEWKDIMNNYNNISEIDNKYIELCRECSGYNPNCKKYIPSGTYVGGKVAHFVYGLR